MKNILSAAELHEKTIEWGIERCIQNAEKANRIFADFYNNYILPEAQYGHHEVTIRNYTKELGLEDAGVTTAFLDCLKKLGYNYETCNVRANDTSFLFEGTLTVKW